MTELLRILRLFRPVWGWMALAAALAAVTVLASVALLALSGWFVAAMGLAGLSGAAMNYFTPAAMIRAFAIVRTAGRYGDRVIGHDATLRIVTPLRVWLFEQLVPLAPFGSGAFRSADLMTRLRGDVERLELVFLRIAVPAVVAAVTALVTAVVVAIWHPLLAVAVVALLAVAGILVPALAAMRADAPGRRMAQASADLNTSLVDVIEGLAELEAYGATEQAMVRVTARSGELVEAGQGLAGILAASQATVGLCANLALLAALLLLIPPSLERPLDGASLVMLTLLAWAAFECVFQMPAAAQSIGATRASARRVLAIADARPPVEEPRSPKPLPPGCELEFSGVSLRYPGRERSALEDIDLVLECGRHVGIIGASGSGKSSLVHLALRLIEPASGAIRLGGIDVRDLRSNEVRSAISVAPQVVHLFTGTIADNLRIACPDATDSQLQAACRAAQLHGFVAAQPAGYDTFVGTAGLKLSGGQVRRLAVARALLKSAPIVVLDEPTEGLDDDTARALLHSVTEACRDRALLVISHRTAGLETFGEIIVLDGGRVIDRGAPAPVLKRK